MADRRLTMRRVLVRLAVVIACCVLVPVLGLFVMQDRFVYGPDDAMPPVGSVVVGGAEVTYPASDGTTEHGWFAPARGTATGITVVAFHGYYGNRAQLANEANQLSAAGFGVLLAEYRGFGGAPGTPSEEGLTRDALAAAAYARSRPDVDPSAVVYLGYSLGTGVVVEAAEISPPAALVLWAPYTSLPDVAWDRLPGLPYRLLMHTQFDSRTRIANVHAPVLVIRGGDDRVVPPDLSQLVFDRANEPKQIVTIAGADHDLQGPAGPSAIAETVSFLKATLA